MRSSVRTLKSTHHTTRKLITHGNASEPACTSSTHNTLGFQDFTEYESVEQNAMQLWRMMKIENNAYTKAI